MRHVCWMKISITPCCRVPTWVPQLGTAGELVDEWKALVHTFRDHGTLSCQEGATGATEGLFGASQLQN